MIYKNCSLWNSLTLAMLLVSIAGCKPEVKDPGEETPPTEEKPVEPPRQIVSLEQAKKTYDAYTERRINLIEKTEAANPDGSKFIAARYTYYDYATVKQYMAYIEQEAKAANVEISSLRFYFSNYPDSTSFESGREILHPRQNSIFLIPATKKGDLEYPFYLTENQEGSYEPVLLTGQLEPYDRKDMEQAGNSEAYSYAGFVPRPTEIINTAAFQGQKKSLIMNEGSSAPPPNH